jgi:hypothetical protein
LSVAVHTSDDFEACYQFIRACGAVQPFESREVTTLPCLVLMMASLHDLAACFDGQQNLLSLYERNRSALAAAATAFSRCFIRIPSAVIGF